MVFSRIGLRKGYHQIPINTEDVQKTVITTPLGLFEHKKMTFSIRNARVSQAYGDCMFCLEGCGQRQDSYVP